MTDRTPGPRMRLSATVIDTRNPRALATFYERLLDWVIGDNEAGWVTLRPRAGGAGLSFQLEPLHTPPVWPSTADDPQMMSHLDIAVSDLDEGVQWAIDGGATVADHQPQPDVRVMLDPDGNPFCLFQGDV